MQAAELGGRRFEWGRRVYIAGIVNVTPDSFSGDGVPDADLAVAQGLRMVEAGADMLDVGGESTRPGHRPVAAGVELRRVLPVVDRLARTAGVPVSIDTNKLSVAEAAVAAGAAVINDIWGLRRAPGMAGLAARSGAALIVMHNQEGTRYGDLVADVEAGLRLALRAALAAGVPPERVILDPGIGFGKTAEQNLVVLRALARLRAIGQPLMVGASRKSFFAALGLAEGERDLGTAAATVASVLRGADLVRVHDVATTRVAVRVAEALR